MRSLTCSSSGEPTHHKAPRLTCTDRNRDQQTRINAESDTMSGFEVAGIVLGSIPLIVSTLENYYDGVRTIQRWRKASTVLLILINDLDNERLRLQNICEKLLNGLVPSRQIDAMVESPMGELWLEKDTQQKIRARLWRSWDVFEKRMVSIQQATEEIKLRLGDAAEVLMSNWD